MARLVVVLACLLTLLAAAPASALRHGDRIPRGADKRLKSKRARAAAAGSVSQLASAPWCGTATDADDVAHQAALGNAIKVVYARTAGAPDRFADYASVIQRDLKLVTQAFLASSAGERSVRFDVGTACGPGYVDIQSAALPHTRAEYLAMGFNTRINTLGSDLRSRVACVRDEHGDCTRDFLVYADGLYAGDGTTGVASRYTDTTPGSGNRSNTGGLFAYVLGNGSADFGISAATTAEHEMLHNLGAVQENAPHSTGGGHCFDEVDVMCYPDGGIKWTSLVSCPSAAASLVDCGHDDYFKPDGDLLDADGIPTWNVFDSAFLCPPETCLAAPAPPAPEPAPTQSVATITPAPAPVAAPTLPPMPPAPASQPVIVSRPPAATAAADPLAPLARWAQARISTLFHGKPLRIAYTSPRAGRFTARLTLGSRTIVAASLRARAGRRATATLRLTRAERKRLRRSRSRLRIKLAFS